MNAIRAGLCLRSCYLRRSDPGSSPQRLLPVLPVHRRCGTLGAGGAAVTGGSEQ